MRIKHCSSPLVWTANVSVNGDRRMGRFHDPPTRYGPGYPERSPLRAQLMECRWAGRVRCVETGTGMSATSYGPMSHSKDIGYILSRRGDATFGSSRGSAVCSRNGRREPSSFARFSSSRRKRPLSVPSNDEFVPANGRAPATTRLLTSSRFTCCVVGIFSSTIEPKEILIRNTSIPGLIKKSWSSWWSDRDNKRLRRVERVKNYGQYGSMKILHIKTWFNIVQCSKL